MVDKEKTAELVFIICVIIQSILILMDRVIIYERLVSINLLWLFGVLVTSGKI